MLFINTLPTKTVVQMDHAALFERLTTELKVDEFAQIKWTSSQRVGFIFWVKKNKPEWKVTTRQMTLEHEPVHDLPLTYMIAIYRRSQ